MEDLRACLGVTKKPLLMEDYKFLLREALGEDFDSFIEKQEEIKEYPIEYNDEKTIIQVFHLGVNLKSKVNLEGKQDEAKVYPIEFQFMDENAYMVVDRGYRAHWVYKLEAFTGQKFDRKFLQDCAAQMSGNLDADLKMIQTKLLPWIYLYILDGESVRIARRNSQAIPLDVAMQHFNGDLSHYNGVELCKIWEIGNPGRKLSMPKRFRVGETHTLQDGDLLRFVPLQTKPGEKGRPSDYLRHFISQELIGLAKHEGTTNCLIKYHAPEPAKPIKRPR
jgi:hypothetical protein